MAPTTMKVLRRGDPDWGRLTEAWRSVADASPQHSPFLASEWIETWLKHSADLDTTGLIWFDAAEMPVACALLSMDIRRFAGLPVRRAFLNATGGPAVGSEHNSILAVTGDVEDRALEDLVRYAVAECGTDEFVLDGATDSAFEVVRSVWPSPTLDTHLSESPYVDLDQIRAGEREYVETLSRNTRYQVRRSMRLYEEAYGGLEYLAASTTAERLAWLDELEDLHRVHWQARGAAGAFSDGRLAFHQDLLRATARTAIETNELRAEISRLVFGDTTIGILYHLVYRGRVYFYQSGLVYQDDARLKPGLVSHAMAIEHFRASGLSEYDFLGGEPEPVRYKRSLATDRRPLVWARFRTRSPKMAALEVARGLRQRIMRGGSAP